MAQSVRNPMISAWGIIWTDDAGIEIYSVQRRVLATGSFQGSPFEAVIQSRTAFRRRLVDLSPEKDHAVLLELAEAGGTDYLALPIEYGDGSVQVSSFASNGAGGFSQADIETLVGLAPAMAAALEPAAMRHSTESLLEVYLGVGPAERVVNGEFRRGDISEIEAVVVLTDLRDFTGQSEQLAPKDLLERLSAYFEIVVDAVRNEGGDVLKFVGDGVLSVFPVEGDDRKDACRRAVAAIAKAYDTAGAGGPAFVAALHVGPVIYGNIGSLDRLDFTVVGPTVNYVSRLEAAAKQLDQRAVCSADVANALPGNLASALGNHRLKGFAEAQAIFALKLE